MDFVNGVKDDFDKLKSELNNKVVTSTSGGGIVTVSANARLEIIKIEIEDSVFKGNDKLMLQELIKSAVNDALRKAEQKAVEELKNLDPGMFVR